MIADYRATYFWVIPLSRISLKSILIRVIKPILISILPINHYSLNYCFTSDNDTYRKYKADNPKNTASGHLNTEAVFHLLLLLINDISFIKKDPSKRDKHDKVDNKHGY